MKMARKYIPKIRREDYEYSNIMDAHKAILQNSNRLEMFLFRIIGAGLMVSKEFIEEVKNYSVKVRRASNWLGTFYEQASDGGI